MNKKLKLEPEYIIGIPGIDLQHSELLRKCNELLDCLERQTEPRDSILVQIQKIIEELRLHFDTEQILLDMIDFPGKDKQRSNHQELLGLLVRNPELFTKRSNDEIKVLISTFRDSYLVHILESDREFAIHIENLMKIKQKYNITALKAQSIIK